MSALMQGCLALLVTAWVVSDNAPGTPAGWAAPAFVGLGLLAAGLVPAMLHVQESGEAAGRYLLIALLTHLLPFGLAVWGAAAWMEGTAYAFLVPWCWGVLGGCALAHLGGALWRLRGPRATP